MYEIDFDGCQWRARRPGEDITFTAPDAAEMTRLIEGHFILTALSS